MAVVTVYGTGAKDPASRLQIDSIYAAAEIRSINSQITITNGNSIASLFWLGNIPSDAILDPGSQYDYAAITGVSDFDVGFYYPDGGAVIDADALIDGDDISSAGAQTLKGHGTLTTANGMKRAWELAGLASDPGGNLAIVATLKAAATATGVVNFFLKYFKDV